MPAGTSTELRRYGSDVGQLGADGGDRQPRRPGVRRGERVGAEADHHASRRARRRASAAASTKRAPADVGLVAGEQQHVVAVGGRGRPAA